MNKEQSLYSSAVEAAQIRYSSSIIRPMPTPATLWGQIFILDNAGLFGFFSFSGLSPLSCLSGLFGLFSFSGELFTP